MIRATAGLALALLAGCVAGPPPYDGCGAEDFQDLVGQPIAAVESRLPAGRYKVDYPLPDGTVTAEDFWDRLRVGVDGDGVIRSVNCG